MHTVREFIEKPFKAIETSIRWKSTAEEEEIGIDDEGMIRIRVRIDPDYYRPTEAEQLLGNLPRPTPSSSGNARSTLIRPGDVEG